MTNRVELAWSSEIMKCTCVYFVRTNEEAEEWIHFIQ